MHNNFQLELYGHTRNTGHKLIYKKAIRSYDTKLASLANE